MKRLLMRLLSLRFLIYCFIDFFMLKWVFLKSMKIYPNCLCQIVDYILFFTFDVFHLRTGPFQLRDEKSNCRIITNNMLSMLRKTNFLYFQLNFCSAKSLAQTTFQGQFCLSDNKIVFLETQTLQVSLRIIFFRTQWLCVQWCSHFW